MIKTMNSKMTTNSQLSTTEPKKQNKNKLSKQQNRNIIREMEITGRVVSEDGAENGGKSTRNKKHSW